MRLKNVLCAFLCVLISLGALSSCNKRDPEIVDPEVQAESYYEYFDTVSVVMSYAGDTPEAFGANCEAVSELLWEYHRLFDIYHEYAGINNLMTVNKNAGVAPVEVDGKLIDFLLYCKEIYTLTDGKTNVAMGSVLKLWHDERERAENKPDKARVPSGEALSTAAQHTNIDALVIDKAAGTVYISDPEMRLDVGAIGKGYATERAAEVLIDAGVTSYVLNIGGNIRAIGTKPSGNGWTTGITNPDKGSDESFVCKVDISDISLVTSGDYERYYVVDGVQYHHIIDPVTLMPAAYFSSVSVFIDDSGLADALSTALFCMSYEDGKQLAESVGADIIWVTADGEVFMTDGVKTVEK